MHEDLFDTEFASFRDSLTPHVTALGPDRVRATVRRRRRAAVVTVAAVTTALVAGSSATVYATLGADRAHRPDTGTTTIPPAPADSPSPTDPAPSSPAPSNPAPPDGRIGKPELFRTTMSLPPWPAGAQCPPQGRIEAEPRPGGIWLTAHAYADVDRDGAEETVIIIRCVAEFGSGVEQAVALDREGGAGIGAVAVLGQVVATDGTIEWLSELDPQPDGSVRVKVGDILPFDDQPADWVHHQWRTYAWNGERFRQTGGPTEFGPNPNFSDLKVTASDVVFTKKPGDYNGRQTVLTVTVRNTAGHDADNLVLVLSFHAGAIRNAGAGWNACTRIWNSRGEPGRMAETVSCQLGGLRVGEQRTLALGIDDSEATPAYGPGEVRVYRNGRMLPLPDRNEKDNRAQFDVR